MLVCMIGPLHQCHLALCCKAARIYDSVVVASALFAAGSGSERGTYGAVSGAGAGWVSVQYFELYRHCTELNSAV